MPHDFYVVLGVSKDADLQQIRRAYRRLVKLYHPDVAGAQVEKFLEIRKAYEALSDEESRSSHDRELSEGRPAPPAEPLVVHRRTRQAPVARRRRTPPRPEEMGDLFSAVDEFFSGWVPGFFTSGRGASRHKNLYVELILEPHEAAGGGLFPLQIPTEQACPECEGSGYQGELTCRACRGHGRSVDYHQIEVSIPPGVATGTEARIALDDIGLNGVDLIVLVTVS